MTSSIRPEKFLSQANVFLEHIMEWEQHLPKLNWEDIAPQATHTAVFSVDMINGFCHEGALASPRVKNIIPAVVAIFQEAYALGVREFILAQDAHTPASVEFADFPPHCQQGTLEAENIPELAQLPFAALYKTFAKNSLNAFHATELNAWLAQQKDLQIAIVVGDCTDLCVYQTAMHLKLHANAHNRNLRVIVPANAVQTYDTPVAVAKEMGILPHDAEVLHLIFLHHMRLNGIEIVRMIQAPIR